MPDLTYQQSVTPEELPGRAFPHLPGSVPSGDFGGEIGRGIEFAGEEVQRHTDAVMQQARQTQLTDAHNQLQTLSMGLTHDPNTGFLTLEGKNTLGAAQGYLSKYDEQAAQIVSGVADPRAKQAAQLAAAQVRMHLSEQMDTHTIGQMKSYMAKTAQTSVELAEQTAAANYNHPDILATQRDHIDASLENLAKQQGWSDEMLTEAKYQHHVKMNEGVIDNMLGDDKPELAKAYFDHMRGEMRPQDAKKFEQAIEAGQVKAKANSILSAYRQDTNVGAKQLSALERSDMTPEQQSHVIQQVEQGRRELAIQRQQDPAIRQQMTALDGAIASGTVTQAGLGSVESLWRKGALTDEQRLVMRDQILRKTKEDGDKNGMLAYVTDHYNSRTPMDPKDEQQKKAVNLFLAESTIGVQPGDPRYNNMATEITARTGIVPTSAVAYGRSGLVGGDPETAGRAAQFLASLQRANPRAYAEATDPETRAMAGSINEMTAAGTPSDKAVDIARKNAQLSQGERQMLNERWNQQRPSGAKTPWLTLDTNLIRHGLADDEHYTTPGMIWGRNSSSVPDVPPDMAAEFGTLTRDYFNHTGGNLQLAHQLALNDLKSVWGVSEVNGKRELVKFAPERMVPGLTAEEIRYDMGKEGYGAAHLVESPETALSGGRRWSLAEKDDFGLWRPVTNSRGTPVSYELPKPSQKSSFEQELQETEDRQKLNATRQREEVAAEHPVMGAGF